ncbi:MAG: exodeoxyribonuclease VII large subunit [Neisseria sp.]|nr:exodeoxyribonuclease VII large subunit [Neisseria sp.]
MSDYPATPTLSVSELNAMAKTLLEDYLSDLWIAGEVSNFSRSAGGHCYFLLKDSGAQVRCAMFKGTAWRFPALKDGDHVEVLGRVGIYAARGEFQIAVSDIRMCGLGRLYEAYEQLKAELKAEGLFDAQKKKSLPSRPRRIGIITSSMAAALRDVVSTLKRRAPEIPLVLYPTAVQGAGSGIQIAQTIREASDRVDADVLIICRGGGNIEDLWAFNEERVVRAVAACAIPVVSGVGHETDFTLTDFAADVRAPTPTAAAELVSPNRTDVLDKLDGLASHLNAGWQRHYAHAEKRLEHMAGQILHPLQQLAARQKKLDGLRQLLDSAAAGSLGRRRQDWANMAARLACLRPDTARHAAGLNNAAAHLARGRTMLLAQKQQGLERQQELLEAVSPLRILARGFAVVKNSRGKIVRDAAELRLGQRLLVTFAEGEADVQVTSGREQMDLFDQH